MIACQRLSNTYFMISDVDNHFFLHVFLTKKNILGQDLMSITLLRMQCSEYYLRF